MTYWLDSRGDNHARFTRHTRTFIWAVTNDLLLTQNGREIIEEAEDVYVSAASIWEIAIKPWLSN